MLRIVLLGGLLISNSVVAAPFLVCDPYPATGQQPVEFVVTVSGIANSIISPAVDAPGGKALHLDLGPLNLTGSRTVTAKARNLWGESADSAPLAFSAGTPVTPGGLGLSIK